MRVLVVGGLEPSLVDSLLHLGHEVLLCHDVAHSERVRRLHRAELPKLPVRSGGSPEAVLGALTYRGLDRAVDCVVPGGELEVVSCAVVGRALGARAMAVSTAVACRDKAVQKQRWRAHGVPVADWVVLDGPGADAGTALAQAGISLPCVVKPLDEGGTSGVALVRSSGELEARTRALSAPLLVEQFIDLPEWHFDGVVQSGQTTHLMVSRYQDPLLGTKRGVPVQSLTYPEKTNGGLYRTARTFTAKAAAALGLSDGVFHFEAFGDGQDFTAGELACRPGGGMIPQVGSLVIDVDLWDALARLLTGSPVSPRNTAPPEDYIGFVNLPSVADATNTVDVKVFTRRPGVVDVVERTRVGEIMRDMTQAVGFGMGYVMARARTHAELAGLLDDIVDDVREAHQDRKPVTS